MPRLVGPFERMVTNGVRFGQQAKVSLRAGLSDLEDQQRERDGPCHGCCDDPPPSQRSSKPEARCTARVLHRLSRLLHLVVRLAKAASRCCALLCLGNPAESPDRVGVLTYPDAGEAKVKRLGAGLCKRCDMVDSDPQRVDAVVELLMPLCRE